jgi:hypothetical protein
LVLNPIVPGNNVEIKRDKEPQSPIISDYPLEKDCSILNSNQVDLPIWSTGHFWEYNMFIILHFTSICLSIDVTRMDLKVTGINEYDNEYNLELSGYIDKIEYSGLDIPMKATYLSGNAHINKSTLAMNDFTLVLSGNSQELVKIDFNIIMKMEFNHGFDFLEFPFNINKELWNITTNVNFFFNSNVKVNGVNNPFKYSFTERPFYDELSVIKNESISVPAGDFESFLISGKGDRSELWYSSDVGYLVKVNEYIAKFLNVIGFNCYLELLSTNFNYPKDNNPPNISDINGPAGGNAGIEYEYMISTTDPEGEQVYYKIDWGDGICSDWLGPYISGEKVMVNHTWADKAIYKIRVKAKDANGYQTFWSNPYIVNMPKNKIISNLLLFKFLEYFSLIKRLLKLL